MTKQHRGSLRWLTLLGVVALWGCSVSAPPAPRPIATTPIAATSSGTRAVASPPPAEPEPPPPVAALPQGSLYEQATACLSDPLCPRDEATRLYLAAADADQLPVTTDGLWAGLPCYVLLRGGVASPDPARARRCFERVVAASDCRGGSPWLPRFELAVLLLSGRGGPAEPARVDGLLAGCFEDGSVQLVRQKARDAQRNPGRYTKLDFCRDLPGTTLAMNGCAQVDSELASLEALLIAKEPQFTGTRATRDAFAAAQDAFTAYAHAHAAWSRDFVRGGTMAPLVYTGTFLALVEERNAQLRAIATTTIRTSEAARKAAARELRRTYEDARLAAQDGQRRKLLDQAQHAFVGYRKAEMAVYAAVLAGQHGEQAVRGQASTDLSMARCEAIRDGFLD